jgi:hypothetical protein
MDRRCFLLTGILLLNACASQSKLRDAELAQLLEWYPGHYSTVDQAGSPMALELNVVRIYAPLMGEHVFYAQETAADDPRRVIAQRVVSFGVVKGAGIVQSLWSPAEPTRWRDAHLNADLFKGLQPEDFKRLSGCELTWVQKDGRFTGANDMKTCRNGSGRMDLRAELTSDELALADLSYDFSGRLVQGNAAEPFYRFRKR